MEDILFIVHRIPFPPNKGDKIRSFNMLKFLAKHYRVHLATFIDDPEDEKYAKELDAYTVDKKIVSVNPLVRRVASMTALLTGEPLSNRYYQSSVISRWVDDKVKNEGVKKAVLFSSPMAQFLSGDKFNSVHRIMDFVDVDSEKWLQYSEKHRFPMSLVFAREGKTLRTYERKVANEFEASLLVSDQEAKLFKEIAPESASSVHAMLNGVNTDYFDNQLDFPDMYDGNKQAIVFTGAMDYWANVDAVTWFVTHIFPSIKKTVKEARFYIVGTRPTDKVKELSKTEGVVVTGSVEDVRPYIKHASLSVAPMKIARGIQNKVLEAMAMSKVVVATPEAMEGISSQESGVTYIESDEAAFAKRITDLLINGDQDDLGEKCRAYVLSHFSWDSHLNKINELMVLPQLEK